MQTQSHKYKVRLATLDDTSWVVGYAAKEMLTSEASLGFLYNESAITTLFKKVVEDETSFIVEADGAPVGVIAGAISPHLFNPLYKTFVELIWYILPEHRATRATLLLLNSFTKKGEDLDMDTILTLRTCSSISIESMAKRGYSLEELNFIKEKEKQWQH